jgi:hypothetical protein
MQCIVGYSCKKGNALWDNYVRSAMHCGMFMIDAQINKSGVYVGFHRRVMASISLLILIEY